MKKIFSVLLAGSLIFGMTSSLFAETDYKIGDVTGDGVVNDEDVTRLTRYINDWDGIKIDIAAADVNKDGTVDKKDLAKLREFIGNWKSEPAEKNDNIFQRYYEYLGLKPWTGRGEFFDIVDKIELPNNQELSNFVMIYDGLTGGGFEVRYDALRAVSDYSKTQEGTTYFNRIEISDNFKGFDFPAGTKCGDSYEKVISAIGIEKDTDNLYAESFPNSDLRSNIIYESKDGTIKMEQVRGKRSLLIEDMEFYLQHTFKYSFTSTKNGYISCKDVTTFYFDKNNILTGFSCMSMEEYQ